MSPADRTMLVEVHTALKFVQADLAELKSEVKSERADVAKLKAKVYTVSGTINGITLITNVVLQLLTKLPHFTA